MDKEKIILQIMREAEADNEPLTREEAEEVYEMEVKAKGIKRYEQAEVTKEKVKRQPKIDEEKVKIISELDEMLADIDLDILNLTIVNPQCEISFQCGENVYSLKLIKHRPKK